MTTEYRPLLTAAEALAALDKLIEFRRWKIEFPDGDPIRHAHAYFATQAAEIEALRIEVAALSVACDRQRDRADAAEARAARLAEALEALALTADGIGVPVYFADVQRLRDATHAARAALGPGGGA